MTCETRGRFVGSPLSLAVTVGRRRSPLVRRPATSLSSFRFFLAAFNNKFNYSLSSFRFFLAAFTNKFNYSLSSFRFFLAAFNGKRFLVKFAATSS
jgi:hypothetical protein